MAIPSDKYNVDYTDGNGLKWSKALNQIYTTLGNIDMSAAISSFNDPLVKNVYRKSRTYNPVYDNSITYTSVGHDSLVMKYFARNAYPTDEITSGTVIIDHASPDGISYATGVNEDASVPYNGGMGTSRVLVDTEYNKMLFKVNLREMDLNTSNVPIPNTNYNDPTYTDVELKDIDDNKWYGLFYHNGAKVWNGSSWVDANIAPVLICSGDSVQSFQGGGSAFNNLFNNYNGTMGSGQNIEFTNAASNYYWTARNFVNRMNIENYSMGWSDNYDYKPSFADDFDSMKAFMLNYLTENSYSPWQSVWFQLCREVHQISNDMSVLLTVLCYACLDGNNNLFINWDNTYTFPIIKGSSVSKFLAGHGLYYLTDSSADLTGITPDTLHNCSDIWVGEMSADGTTTGRWIKGSDIDTYTGYNKDGNINNPDFDPSGGGGGSTGDDMESMATGASGSSGGFTHFYVMSPQDLIDFLADFYDHASSGETLTNNLVCSYILGIPSSEFCATQDVPIAIHNSAQGTPFVSQADYAHITATNNLLVVGSFDVPRMTNTFYDFAPYSTYEVFIPCCGWVSLPDTVAGRKINVEMYIDIASCCVKAAVKINGLGVCAVTNGVLGAAIPIAVIESGILRGNNIQAGLGIIGGGINTGIGAGSGNTMGIGFGVQQILSGLVDCTIAGNTNYTQQKGGTGDITQFAMGHKCYMKVTHPDIDPVVNEAIFGHSVGYLCNSIGKLSTYKGFTVCGNPHVTFSASAEEREEIERLLSIGVIL